MEPTDEFKPQNTSYSGVTIKRSVDDLDRYGNWLGEQVRNWTPTSDIVHNLRDLLYEVYKVIGALDEITHIKNDPMRFGIDMTNLPSMPIPEWMDTTYPIWAVDHNGWALVGADATKIEHVANIIARSCSCDLDADEHVPFDCIPLTFAVWVARSDNLCIDPCGFILYMGDLIRWGDFVKTYALEVWGSKI